MTVYITVPLCGVSRENFRAKCAKFWHGHIHLTRLLLFFISYGLSLPEINVIVLIVLYLYCKDLFTISKVI